MAAWKRLIQDAQTTDDVLGLVNDFIAGWQPAEVERLPEDCRPTRIADVNDVSDYAFRLVRHQCARDEDAIELQKMVAFFVAASQRLSLVLAYAAHAATTLRARI